MTSQNSIETFIAFVWSSLIYYFNYFLIGLIIHVVLIKFLDLAAIHCNLKMLPLREGSIKHGKK